jgi:hypothetical protein
MLMSASSDLKDGGGEIRNSYTAAVYFVYGSYVMYLFAPSCYAGLGILDLLHKLIAY